MNWKTPIIAVALLFLLFNGCNEALQPKGPYEEKVVVFAILTTTSDTQYVRIYKTYDPPEFDPLGYTTDNAVAGALVSISDGSTVHQFRDTTIVRTDKSRFSSDIKAYVAYNFAAESGKTYTLNIALAPGGKTFQAQATVSQQASMVLGTFAALSNPFSFQQDVIDLNCILGASARGFIVKAYIEYDLKVNNVWVPTREEFPIGVRNLFDCRNYEPVLHQLQRRRSLQPEQVFYSVLGYITTLRKIWNVNNRLDVRLKQAVFELTQFDRNLYDYYNVANGFRDEFSIRSDELDYSNIAGGLGIFGAMAKQSLTIALPDTLGSNLTCQ